MNDTKNRTVRDRTVRPAVDGIGWPLGALLAAGACVPLGGCAIGFGGDLSHEAREQLTLTEALGARKVVVRNVVGDVELQADPGATEFSATATMIGRGRTADLAQEALSEIDIRVDPSASEAGVIDAVASHPNGSNRKQYSVHWKIIAPPNVEVSIETDVGDVEIGGIEGPAWVRADVGDIKVVRVARGLTIRSGVGDVEASAGGEIDVQTDVGDATVKVLAGETRPVKITTDVGEIELFLPQQWAGAIDAECDTGDVSVRLAGLPIRTSRASEDHFEGQVGDGGPLVTLQTDVGDIDVRVSGGTE